VVSGCDPVWGYARCDVGRCELSGNETFDGKVVTRGTFVDATSGDECAPYFRCAVGWYKRFSMFGKVDCAPCVGISDVPLARFVTGGVSAGDSGSCLWECDSSKPGVAWDFTARMCVQRGASGRLPRHPAGSYGVERGVATCRPLHTSQENSALVVGDCLACPPMPANAVEVVGARNCEWECVDGWTRRGARCVRGLAVASSTVVPFNRPGTRKKALVPVRVASERVVATVASSSSAGARMTTLASSGGAMIVAGSVSGGVSGRHWVEVDGVRVGVEGPVCSGTLLAMGGSNYLVCAVCNESFVAFVNLSAPPDVDQPPPVSASRRLLQLGGEGDVRTTYRQGRQALQVLIGKSGESGWADGFKTQARFGVELHVTAGGGSVWVLDRWNCVVREVVVWPGGPGDYRTRVYTVHGLTERFLLVPPTPKCYGDGSLAGPRRFLEVEGWVGLALFSDDTGLWQLDPGTGELGRVVDEAWGVGTRWFEFEADDLVSVRFGGVPFVSSQYNRPSGARKCSTNADCQYPQCLTGACTQMGDLFLCVDWKWGGYCPSGFCPTDHFPVFRFGILYECRPCPVGTYVVESTLTTGICMDKRVSLTLGFKDGTEWDLVANTEPCPPDTTSRMSGECTVGCAWQDGSNYVDPSTGACVSCGGLQCGFGQQLVKCTRSAPARCEACPVRGGAKVYAVAGRCDEDEMRYLAPCPPGFYLGSGGVHCEACGDPLRTTVFSGGTRVEQCKCKAGLRWSKELGKCVGRDLYVYDGWMCADGWSECVLPAHAKLAPGGGGGWARCAWECDAGYYRVMDRCEACQGGRPEDATTRGDDDSPLSCEYFR
jgi:hypothetical protein